MKDDAHAQFHELKQKIDEYYRFYVNTLDLKTRTSLAKKLFVESANLALAASSTSPHQVVTFLSEGNFRVQRLSGTESILQYVEFNRFDIEIDFMISSLRIEVKVIACQRDTRLYSPERTEIRQLEVLFDGAPIPYQHLENIFNSSAISRLISIGDFDINALPPFDPCLIPQITQLIR